MSNKIEVKKSKTSKTSFKPNKLGLKLILGGKYKNKISVEDIKQRIYDEMEDNTKLQVQVHQLEDRLKEIDEWKEKKIIADEMLSKYKERINTKEEEIDNYRGNIEKLGKENKNLKAKLSDQKMAHDNEVKLFKENIKELEKENKKLSSLITDIDEYKEKIKDLEKEISKRDKEISKLKSKVGK